MLPLALPTPIIAAGVESHHPDVIIQGHPCQADSCSHQPVACGDAACKRRPVGQLCHSVLHDHLLPVFVASQQVFPLAGMPAALMESVTRTILSAPLIL